MALNEMHATAPALSGHGNYSISATHLMGSDGDQYVMWDAHAPRHTDYAEDFRIYVADIGVGDEVRYAVTLMCEAGSASVYTSDPFTLARQLRAAADALDGANVFA